MADIHRIRIRPFGERSWSLSFGSAAQAFPMLFRSGARAEAAARSLAVRLSDVGEDAEIVIELRDGSIAGRFVAFGASQV